METALVALTQPKIERKRGRRGGQPFPLVTRAILVSPSLGRLMRKANRSTLVRPAEGTQPSATKQLGLRLLQAPLLRCRLVHLEHNMNNRTERRETANHRISVSFTAGYLERTAQRKWVSIAWVIRGVVENLIADKAPLFSSDNR